MPFTEIELKLIANTVGKMCGRRSPPHFRDQVRISHYVKDRSVEVYEERPRWKDKNKWTSTGVAKFVYVKTTQKWKLYWVRADLRWHLYQPLAESRSIEKLVTEVDKDPHGAFFG